MSPEQQATAPPLWERVARFARKPYKEKRYSLEFRLARRAPLWIQRFPRIPFPVYLRSGYWWLVRNDASGKAMLDGSFEVAELAFVHRYLRAGMVMLDIGAHHGLYTLLASRSVGSTGRVIAFEPSPRERIFLKLHIFLNRCNNVAVERFALGESKSKSTLFVVESGETWCNSLRVPDVTDPVRQIRVAVRPLDAVLDRRRVRHVDFIKVDAEGAELAILRGADKLLRNRPRPVLLVEVQDVRTAPWGYAAREIVDFLSGCDYCWFRVLQDGRIQAVAPDSSNFDGNFVAVPREGVGQLESGLVL